MIIAALLVLFLIISFPVGLYLFSGEKVTKSGVKSMLYNYRYHFLLLIIVYFAKRLLIIIEPFVEPYAFDATPYIHAFEVDLALQIQQSLMNYPLTVFLATVYTVGFVFVIVFTLMFLAYLDLKEAASKMMFFYLVIFLATIPFYLFMLVQVTAFSLPGIEPLLYDFGPNIWNFFNSHETFNNCVPSLHIGYPVGVLLVLQNVEGYKGLKWTFFVLILITSLAVVYLGIHWVIDVPLGVLVAVFAYLVTEKYSERFWRTYG